MKPDKKTSSNLIVSIGFLLSLVIFIIDLQTPLGIADGILYVGVMLLSIWTKDRKFIIITAITAICLIITGYLFSPSAPLVAESYIAITNRLFSIIVVIICAFLIIKYKKIEQKTIDLAIDVIKGKREEDKFKAILESAPDAIVIVNSAGKIHLVNVHTENLFGYNRDEIIGKEMEMLMPSRCRHTHHSHRKNFSDNPKVRPMGAGVELFAQHKDGKEFSVEISLSPLETEEGSLVSAAIRDVTSQKLLKKELTDAKMVAEHVLAP